jgi:predicted DNA-binding transcriptional regulator AlpA
MSESETPREGEERRLLNLTEVAQRRKISRQRLHVLRTTDPDFPPARRRPGSTRDFYDASEVDAYFERRVRRPGWRTDIKGPAPEQ